VTREITYSPSYTLVPTYECFNRCSYCNFRVDPGKGSLITTKQAQDQLNLLDRESVIEILILSGEVHPQSPARENWFTRIYELSKLSLQQGYLPHTNVGPLSKAEMSQLAKVNLSMGLMLEQVSQNLESTVHRYAPSKKVQLRLEQLDLSGELRIPFTTGLLLGIGESQDSWWASLEAIASIWRKWGHIQEVILQPFSPQSSQDRAFDLNLLPDIVKNARQILPNQITIQIPPNLVTTPKILLACLEAGARDLGGIGPIDEVNPTYQHMPLQLLQETLQSAGWLLKPRLPIYPEYYDWLSSDLQQAAFCRSAMVKTD